jgi:tetratricopeptide (TPR) repeat protein
MKKIALVLSLILILCSVTAILLETRYRNDLRLQRLLARFSLLSDQRVLKAADELRDKAAPESLKQAIVLYREALSRDLENPYRWCDLGLALLDSKQIAEARRCYERAAALGPNNIQTLWRVAKFYEQINEPREVFRYASHMLDKDPSVWEDVFFLYTPFDFAETLSYGIPQNRVVAQSFLRYLMGKSETAQAEQCWSWVTARSLAGDNLAGEYLSFLIRSGEPARARDAWFAYSGDRSLVYNPGFEAEPKPVPFDWNISKIDCAEVSRDPSVRHEGTWSLRIEFDGKENVSYQHVGQSVFLDAGKYVLKGFVRTEGITTDKGIGLRAASFATKQLTGANDWTELIQPFDLAQPTMIRVEIFRQPSERFANKLAGTAWIDGVALTRR